MCPDVLSWHESTLAGAMQFGAELRAFRGGSDWPRRCTNCDMRLIRLFPRSGSAVFIAALALCSIPGTASAVTLEQVVSMSKAGVSESVIVALVERDETVFTIEPDQVVKLQKDGLSDSLIMTMLKSGRAEGEAAARADAAANANRIAASLSPAPEVVIVGHGPDVPNVAHYNGFYSGPPLPVFDPFVFSYSAGYPGAYGVVGGYGIPPGKAHASRAPRRRDTSATPAPRPMCLAQVATGPSPSSSRTFVTECPAVMVQAR
jgi:hypothetical protein